MYMESEYLGGRRVLQKEEALYSKLQKNGKNI